LLYCLRELIVSYASECKHEVNFKKSVTKRTILCSVQSRIDRVLVVNIGFHITKSLFLSRVSCERCRLGHFKWSGVKCYQHFLCMLGRKRGWNWSRPTWNSRLFFSWVFYIDYSQSIVIFFSACMES